MDGIGKPSVNLARAAIVLRSPQVRRRVALARGGRFMVLADHCTAVSGSQQAMNKV